MMHRTGLFRERADWVIWAATRAFLMLIISGAIPWPEQVHDLDIYQRWFDQSLRHGHFPTDEMWQYPPLAGPVFAAGALLPGGRLGFALVFACFDAALMVLITRGSAPGRWQGRRLWAWAPLFVGPLLLARFDVVPTTLAVGALLAASRPGMSGAIAAVGAWLKVWPALTVLGLPRRALPRAVAAACLVSLAIGGVLLATTTDSLTFLTGQRERGIQIESVAAWPFLVARLFGAQVAIVYQFGSHEIVAPGVSQVGSLCAALSLLAIAAVVALRLIGRIEGHAPADVTLTVVLLSVVTSRVFSGQYFIWLLGLAALALGQPTNLASAIKWMLAAGLSTHLVYPWLYSALLDGSPVAVAVQSVRIVTILVATVLATRELLAGPRVASS